MKRFIADQRGVTLVELLIVISLIAIVIGLGYRYYDFGTRSFGRGESKAGAQQNTRLAADYILQEIRYSKNMEILNSAPQTFLNDYSYIFVNNHGQFTHVENGNENTVFSHIAQGIDFELNFDLATKQDPEGDPGETVKVSGNKTLDFLVSAGEEDYSIESASYLRHLEGIIGGESGIGIRYQKHEWSPEDALNLEEELLEEVDYGCLDC